MIKRLNSGGIITNYHCSAACSHCLYKSSPKREKKYITPGLLRDIFAKGASLGCRSYHIGGGEPFLDYKALLDIVMTFGTEGIGIDYLETNASWYKDPESADEKLTLLMEAGCRTVMVSVCPFHIEYVPLKKVNGVIEACRRTGMDLFLWQEQYYRELAVFDRTKTHSFEELSRKYGKDYRIDAAGRFGLTLNGRALDTLKPHLPSYSAEVIIEREGEGCTELSGTGHFHFDLYGNYIPPGCVGLALDFQNMDEPLSDEKYPHFRILRDEGVAGFFEYTVRNYGFIPGGSGYISKCDLCYNLRKHIVISTESLPDFKDLEPREFYFTD